MIKILSICSDSDSVVTFTIVLIQMLNESEGGRKYNSRFNENGFGIIDKEYCRVTGREIIIIIMGSNI